MLEDFNLLTNSSSVTPQRDRFEICLMFKNALKPEWGGSGRFRVSLQPLCRLESNVSSSRKWREMKVGDRQEFRLV